MVVIYITLCFILLYIVFFQNQIFENYTSVVPKEFDQDLLVSTKIAVGKPNAQYNFDVQDSIYSTEHCLRNQDGSHICINRKDIRGLYQEPNYDTRKICIGETCLNKTDIITLKNMSQDTEQDVNLNARLPRNSSTGFIKAHTDDFKPGDITLVKNNAECENNLINEYSSHENDLEHNKVNLGVVNNKEECTQKCLQESIKCGTDAKDKNYSAYDVDENLHTLDDHLCKNISLEKNQDSTDNQLYCYWNRGPCTRTKYNKNSKLYRIDKYPGSNYKKNNNRLKEAYDFMDDIRLRSRVQTNFNGNRGSNGNCGGGHDDFSHMSENYTKKSSRFDYYDDPKLLTNGNYLHYMWNYG